VTYVAAYFVRFFDHELELAVIDDDGQHALVFPCRRVAEGWINAANNQSINVRPTHWRNGRAKRCSETLPADPTRDFG
jgi:hypothetical protein